MPTKTVTNKTNPKTANAPALGKNGENGSAQSEHLAKANKAMTKAWTLISQRQDKRD